MLSGVAFDHHEQHGVRARVRVTFLAPHERAVDGLAHALRKAQRAIGGQDRSGALSFAFRAGDRRSRDELRDFRIGQSALTRLRDEV